LAIYLHISRQASDEASRIGRKHMAKKSLKKVKKLEATKPLMTIAKGAGR
jgi:hypothetical protein